MTLRQAQGPALRDGQGPVKIVVVYQSLLGIYGDQGNAKVLHQRLAWRGIDSEVIFVEPGQRLPADGAIYLLGGGEDNAQTTAVRELKADGTKDSSKFGEARTAGYVGAWNQIFLKIDADQVTAKFMREGARRASDASIARAQEIKAFLAGYLEDTGLRYANMNLVSKTYNSNWSTLVSDVDDWCTQYVMGVMTRDEYLANINNIKNSDIYKAIQAEYKAAAGN